MPVAVNCWVFPAATDAVVGDTAMETSTAAVTVIVAVPEIKPDAAVMVVSPVATAVARPEEEMVATEVFDDDHVTELVRFWVVRSE